MLRTNRNAQVGQIHRPRHSQHFRLDALLVLSIVVLATVVAPRASNALSAFELLRDLIAGSAATTQAEPRVEPPALAQPLADPVHVWIQQQSQSVDPDIRAQAKNNLVQMPNAAVIPALLDSLTDTDPIIRARVAEILGQKKAEDALDALALTLYDPESSVRFAAAQALGELGLPLALTRLEPLQVFETDARVRAAAQESENKIYARVAAELDRSVDSVRAIAVAPSNGRVYAATYEGVYAPAGMGWRMSARLPDLPTALAVSPEDANVLYVGTVALGILRSDDGGKSWTQLDRGLPPAERTTVTAIAVSPTHPRIVFATLAAWFDTVEQNEMPLGLYVSKDAGDSWSLLAQWPQDYATLRMVIDPIAPNYLYGKTETGAWRFPLGKVYCESC